MPAPPHHRTNDQLAENRETPRKARVRVLGAQAQSHIPVSAGALEEDGELAESDVGAVDDLAALGDADAESAEEDVPEVEAELVAGVAGEVREGALGVIWFQGRLVDTEGALFVSVAATHRHCDGEDGDVHHCDEAELDRGIDVSQVKGACSGVAGAGCLKEGGENTWTRWQRADFFVIEVEENDEEHVGEVEDDQNATEDPGRVGGKE